jgi:hypothetical protein
MAARWTRNVHFVPCLLGDLPEVRELAQPEAGPKAHHLEFTNIGDNDENPVGSHAGVPFWIMYFRLAAWPLPFP